MGESAETRDDGRASRCTTAWMSSARRATTAMHSRAVIMSVYSLNAARSAGSGNKPSSSASPSSGSSSSCAAASSSLCGELKNEPICLASLSCLASSSAAAAAPPAVSERCAAASLRGHTTSMNPQRETLAGVGSRQTTSDACVCVCVCVSRTTPSAAARAFARRRGPSGAWAAAR